MTAALLLADSWRIVVLTASAPPAGGVLLLAIARVTGATWQSPARLARFAPILPVLTASLGLAQLATIPPPHLAIWMHPLAVGIRGLVAGGALAWGARRLLAGGGVTPAAILLALYAWTVTPIAADAWLGHIPGQAMSAIGMLAAVAQIGAACAVALLAGWGGVRERQDLGKLLVAAALGLGYLAFMDYLIVWFGNLPTRIGFHLARSGTLPSLIATAALTIGLAAPVALLVRGWQRPAGGCGLAGLVLFHIWWVGFGGAHG